MQRSTPRATARSASSYAMLLIGVVFGLAFSASCGGGGGSAEAMDIPVRIHRQTLSEFTGSVVADRTINAGGTVVIGQAFTPESADERVLGVGSTFMYTRAPNSEPGTMTVRVLSADGTEVFGETECPLASGTGRTVTCVLGHPDGPFPVASSYQIQIFLEAGAAEVTFASDDQVTTVLTAHGIEEIPNSPQIGS